MKFFHFAPRCIPQRFIVSMECLICLTVSYMMRFCLSITITEMTEIFGAAKDNEDEGNTCPIPKSEETEGRSKKMEFEWTAYQQGLIHSGFFWGYILTQIPGGVLSDLLNHKTVLLIGFVGSSVATLITPTVTRSFDWNGLIVCRIFLGLSQGIFYNALHAVTAHWIPLNERGILGTVVFSGAHLGNSLNTLITGYLTAYFGWTTAYYVYSAVGLLWATIFLFTTYTYPEDNPVLSEKEKDIFEDNRDLVDSMKIHKKVPLKQILKNIHVWAIVFAMVGQDWAIYTLVTYIPTYFKSVVHMEVKYIGLTNSIFYVITWILAMVSGYLSDYAERNKLISLTWNRKILFLLGTVFPALGFIGISYTECNQILAVMFMTLQLPPLGLFYPSVKVNPIDLSPNFAGTIGSLAQMGGCIAGIIVPYLLGSITTNSYISEWRLVFWLAFIVTLFGGLTFFIFSSAEVQPFNDFSKNNT